MAVYRVWAECISDVYIDIEAENEDQAYEFARNYVDGGEFHEDCLGDWVFGSVIEVEDVDPDYTVEEVKECLK